MKWDWLIEQVLGEVEVGEVREITDGVRDFTGKIQTLEANGRDVEGRSSGTCDASPVTVVRRRRRRSIGPT